MIKKVTKIIKINFRRILLVRLKGKILNKIISCIFIMRAVRETVVEMTVRRPNYNWGHAENEENRHFSSFQYLLPVPLALGKYFHRTGYVGLA